MGNKKGSKEDRWRKRWPIYLITILVLSLFYWRFTSPVPSDNSSQLAQSTEVSSGANKPQHVQKEFVEPTLAAHEEDGDKTVRKLVDDKEAGLARRRDRAKAKGKKKHDKVDDDKAILAALVAEELRARQKVLHSAIKDDAPS